MANLLAGMMEEEVKEEVQDQVQSEADNSDNQAQTEEVQDQEEEAVQDQDQDQEEEAGPTEEQKEFLAKLKDKSTEAVELSKGIMLLDSYRPIRNYDDIRKVYKAVQFFGGPKVQGISSMAFVLAFAASEGKEADYVSSALSPQKDSKEDRLTRTFRTVEAALQSYNAEHGPELAKAKADYDRLSSDLEDIAEVLKNHRLAALEEVGLSEYPDWMVVYQKQEDGHFWIAEEDLKEAIKDNTRTTRKYNWLGLVSFQGQSSFQSRKKEGLEGFSFDWTICKAVNGWIVLLQKDDHMVLEYRKGLTKAFNSAKQELGKEVWGIDPGKQSTNVKGQILSLPYTASGKRYNWTEEEVQSLKDNAPKAYATMVQVLKKHKLDKVIKELVPLHKED